MRISYNVTGAQRKSLAGAVSQELNAPAQYLGAPTFAYEVGGYRIDKNGTLEGGDNPGLVADLQGSHGFMGVSEEYDTPIPETGLVPDDIQISCDAELGGRVSPYRDFEEPPAYGTTETADTNFSDVLTIEMPLAGFTEENITNLEKIIASKAALIKKAISVDVLPVERTEMTLRFPWFRFGIGPEEVSSYSRFIDALCAAAKEQKRVNAKEKPVENEKFAFRVFLIRLGFIGDEFKAARKTLLKNLSGNSAFKNGVPPKAEVETDE